MKKNKIFVAGHKGMVGNAITKFLKDNGYRNLLLPTRVDLDLTDSKAVEEWFCKNKPQVVILAAAKVGGIHANNTYLADFIYQNLEIQSNLIHSAYLTKVKKLMFLGSSCVYPKKPKIPIKEEYLLTSELENTNEMYAIAKIAGLKMCKAYNAQFKTDFRAIMPTNLYGQNDNYDSLNSHVLAALIKKIVLAKKQNKKSFTVWGTGKPKREFLHVDDLSNAIKFIINNEIEDSILNVGSGDEVSIKSIAENIKQVIDYRGDLSFDKSKPDGNPRKLLDSSKIVYSLIFIVLSVLAI